MYDTIKRKHQQLKQEAESLEAQLIHLPEGKLICIQNGKYIKWYHSHDHQLTYIPKSNRQLAEKLALKTYLSKHLDDINRELIALGYYIRHHKEEPQSALSFLNPSSPYSTLLAPYFTNITPELNSWMQEPYAKNPIFPEQCVHKVFTNLYVRSKSEALIARLLYNNKIPFRYESPLSLGDLIVYPDFTLRHPVTGDYFYWEHFGLMDLEDYRRNTFSKLSLYSTHNIYPGIHLITTYETKEHPLSYEMIENLIKFYFLDN